MFGQKETSINLSGLTSQLEKSFQLLNHIIFNSKASQEVTDGLIQKTLQLRENAVNNPKSILWNGLQNYAVYGEESPLSDQLSNKKLEGLISGEFTAIWVPTPVGIPNSGVAKLLKL